MPLPAFAAVVSRWLALHPKRTSAGGTRRHGGGLTDLVSPSPAGAGLWGWLTRQEKMEREPKRRGTARR